VCHTVFMQKKWMDNPELFCRELLKGYLWQLFVAERFRLCGYDVKSPPMSYQGKDKKEEYADSKDLTVNGHVIEIKSRNYEFTSHLDFPYPTILIDTKAGFEAKKTKPVMFVNVCQLNGAMCALDVKKTFPQWTARRVWDRVRKVGTMTYECEKELWESVDDASERLIGPSDRLFHPSSVFCHRASWSS